MKLVVNDMTFYPEPLVFYAGALNDAPNPAGAAAFVKWLQDAEAQSLFRDNHFDLPGDAKPIHASPQPLSS
jgi:ABC-type molybdate transport system substrate-binding protein